MFNMPQFKHIWNLRSSLSQKVLSWMLCLVRAENYKLFSGRAFFSVSIKSVSILNWPNEEKRSKDSAIYRHHQERMNLLLQYTQCVCHFPKTSKWNNSISEKNWFLFQITQNPQKWTILEIPDIWILFHFLFHRFCNFKENCGSGLCSAWLDLLQHASPVSLEGFWMSIFSRFPECPKN